MVQFGISRTAGFGLSAGGGFEKYTGRLMRAVGDAGRVEPPRLYCAVLPVPGDQERVQPMAARLIGADVRATYERMHHLLADSPSSDRRVLTAVRSYVRRVLEAHGSVRARIVDHTGSRKKDGTRWGCAGVLRCPREAVQLSGSGEPAGS